MAYESIVAKAIADSHGLNEPGVRHFQSLEEVRENLDTITFAECEWVNMNLGIVFDFAGGVPVAAYEDEDLSAVQRPAVSM